ncbi:MAG: methyltransferase domain-containing protein [archaeon GB-1867-035]|nr:methyltransferase domain-containing protein [Candidatus Culexmicrobium profundum]
MKLNIGCGNDKRAGYVNIDVRSEVNPDMIIDVEKELLSRFQDNSCDEIICIDFIEHLSFNRVEDFLKDCHRILKRGGKLIVQVPDIELHCKNILEGKYNWKELSYWIYGAQNHEYNYHKSGFTRSELVKLLTKLGFKVIKIERVNTNTYCEAIKEK